MTTATISTRNASALEAATTARPGKKITGGKETIASVISTSYLELARQPIGIDRERTTKCMETR
jgi:hypothetical protein